MRDDHLLGQTNFSDQQSEPHHQQPISPPRIPNEQLFLNMDRLKKAQEFQRSDLEGLEDGIGNNDSIGAPTIDNDDKHVSKPQNNKFSKSDNEMVNLNLSQDNINSQKHMYQN